MRRILAVLFLAVLSCSPAFSAVISYGDEFGTDVMYTMISEDTRDEPLALFGSPDIVGNTLDFDPLSFSTSSTSSTGTNNSSILDGQLNFTVMSNDNSFDITHVIIAESGDYTLAGLGTAQASATVSAPVNFSVTHVNGSALSAPVSGMGSLVFSPTGGSYSLPADTGGIWSGNLDVDIRSVLDTAGIPGAATKIEFSLDNNLNTASAEGGSAFIAKKDFNVFAIGQVVPEPSSGFLALLAICPLLSQLRRKTRC